MNINTIYNEDCFDTMKQMPDNFVDLILTSPFYNTNKHAGNIGVLKDKHYDMKNLPSYMYDMHVDNMTNEEYNEFTKNLFIVFDRVLKSNGCILYNLSYGAENTTGMFEAVNAIITETPFTIADVICWKKLNAMPNNVSPNRLTRVWEFVFVFCRNSEEHTFHMNKRMRGRRATGQANYENIPNFIVAENNDGICPYNRATYSEDLCKQLLQMYAPDKSLVYDPFMGSGTTAVACKRLNLNYIGSEISKNQCNFAEDRISSMSKASKSLFSLH